MSSDPAESATIPAWVTAEELATAIGHETTEVCRVLASRGEPAAPEDYLDGDLALVVAQALGAKVEIETRDLVLEHLYSHEARAETAAKPTGRARRMFDGIVEEKEDLDRSIEQASEHWSVARMPLVDRNILRLGLYELIHEPDTPAAVIISEAVRLAHAYSTERSAAFVNGVLASLAKTLRGSGS